MFARPIEKDMVKFCATGRQGPPAFLPKANRVAALHKVK